MEVPSDDRQIVNSADPFGSFGGRSYATDFLVADVFKKTGRKVKVKPIRIGASKWGYRFTHDKLVTYCHGKSKESVQRYINGLDDVNEFKLKLSKERESYFYLTVKGKEYVAEFDPYYLLQSQYREDLKAAKIKKREERDEKKRVEDEYQAAEDLRERLLRERLLNETGTSDNKFVMKTQSDIYADVVKEFGFSTPFNPKEKEILREEIDSRVSQQLRRARLHREITQDFKTKKIEEFFSHKTVEVNQDNPIGPKPSRGGKEIIDGLPIDPDVWRPGEMARVNRDFIRMCRSFAVKTVYPWLQRYVLKAIANRKAFLLVRLQRRWYILPESSP